MKPFSWAKFVHDDQELAMDAWMHEFSPIVRQPQNNVHKTVLITLLKDAVMIVLANVLIFSFKWNAHLSS